MYKLITLILISLSLNAYAQIENVKRCLLNKKADKFYESIKSLDGTFNVRLLSRDLTPEFRESMYEIQEIRSLNDSTGGNRVYNYKINLLTTNDSLIAFCEFYEKASKKIAVGNYEFFFQSILKKSYANLLGSLKSNYFSYYKDTVNFNDLFNTEIAYGNFCGAGNEELPYFKKLNELISKARVVEILSWLRSANVEKQLFAIEGLKRLKTMGRPITDQEQKLIDIIKLKRGYAHVCIGCVYSTNLISEISLFK